MDISNRESIVKLVGHAQKFGAVKNLICAAGVSPSQALVEKILQVDLYGTAASGGVFLVKKGNGFFLESVGKR